MSDVKIDSLSCFSRVKRVFDGWQVSLRAGCSSSHSQADHSPSQSSSSDQELESLANVDVIAVVVADAEENALPKKGVALQTWLLAYEFPSTILVFTRKPNKLSILTSQSKAKILSQLKPSNDIELEVVVRPKDAAEARKATADFFARFASNDTTRFGHFVKDAPKGKIADEWKAAVDGAGKTVEFTDVTPAMSSIMGPKDPKELEYHTMSARLCSTVMQHYFKPKMQSLLDKGTKMSHETLAA